VAKDPTHADLLAIHSRLGVIEGKVNLVARAERDRLREELRKTIGEKPLIGQVYLVVDGARTQKQIATLLSGLGIPGASEPMVSRRMGEMEVEHGMIILISSAGGKVYARDPEMEKMLNLTSQVRGWLTEDGKLLPEQPKRRKRKNGGGNPE
jgi:hypothetical protein